MKLGNPSILEAKEKGSQMPASYEYTLRFCSKHQNKTKQKYKIWGCRHVEHLSTTWGLDSDPGVEVECYHVVITNRTEGWQKSSTAFLSDGRSSTLATARLLHIKSCPYPRQQLQLHLASCFRQVIPKELGALSNSLPTFPHSGFFYGIQNG